MPLDLSLVNAGELTALDLDTLLGGVGVNAHGKRDYWRARDYYLVQAECLRLVGDAAQKDEALRKAAEELVHESDLALQTEGRGAITAAAVLSNAVDAFRQIRGCKSRAEELHARLVKLQEQSLRELKPVSTEIDASQLTERAIAAVRDKPFRQAVMRLCQLLNPPDISDLIRQVHEQARVAVFGSMVSTEVLNSKGHVVARASGLNAGASDIAESGLRWRVFQQAQLRRTLNVQAILWPAREEIVRAHAPSRHDVASLVQGSPWIPPNHAESIVRALIAGFDGDMIVAGHIVPIQFEAVVRHVVEIRGGVTSTLESDGTQQERTLGALLESAEAQAAFGRDGVIELQDLLVDPLGSNLRNEVSHALMGDSAFYSLEVAYVWWNLLRVCVLSAAAAEKRNGDV